MKKMVSIQLLSAGLLQTLNLSIYKRGNYLLNAILKEGVHPYQDILLSFFLCLDSRMFPPWLSKAQEASEVECMCLVTQ